MTDRHFAAALGFAFVAAWISFNLGYALLCMIGAAGFWAGAGVLAGTIDLGQLQDRLSGHDNATPSAGAGPTQSTRGRVR